ncbi:MAG: hypothetical protein J5J06_05455 [Phycisphaerae bacterium]|nr:hypothetical protein [Phycisphaerae bacterium]
MTQLSTVPNSSSKLQHQKLVMEAANKGFALGELRKMVGGSLRRLSALECSEWIRHFGGGDLPNPPGKKPRPYGRKRTASVRVITADHVEQITRLGLTHFHSPERFENWLETNFKVRSPEQLLTAARAGEVIHVLFTMHQRARSTGGAHKTTPRPRKPRSSSSKGVAS